MKPIYIKEAANKLNRTPATLRYWEREGILPVALYANRDGRGWRYWDELKLQRIKKYLHDAKIHPGKGLKNYKPSKQDVDKHLASQRNSRKKAKNK